MAEVKKFDSAQAGDDLERLLSNIEKVEDILRVEIGREYDNKTPRDADDVERIHKDIDKYLRKAEEEIGSIRKGL